jgi:hypothetical protein
MGTIFGNAHLTIFAVAGNDPSHGLPGVRSERPPPFDDTTIGQIRQT